MIYYNYVQRMMSDHWQRVCREEAAKAREEEFANYCEKQNQDWAISLDEEQENASKDSQ